MDGEPHDRVGGESAGPPALVEGSHPSGVHRGEPLELGRSISGVLEPETSREHALPLDRGDGISIEVDQRATDVVVEILDPAGRRALVFDGPYGTGAAERICFVAATGGEHRLRLSGFAAEGGAYAIEWLRCRPATRRDRLCAEAARRFMAAEDERFLHKPSPELAESFEAAHRGWSEAGEPFLAAVALRQAGSTWGLLGRNDDSRKALAEALHLATLAGSAYLEIRLRTELAQALDEAGERRAAEDQLERALARCRSTGHAALEATVLSHLALLLSRQGDHHRAIELNHRAVELADEVSMDDGERALMQIQLARAYGMIDRHREALQQMTDALAVLRRVESPSRQIGALTAIGWLHHLRGEPWEGLSFLLEALALAEETGDRGAEIGVLDRLGTIQRACGDFAAALASYRASRELALTLGREQDALHTTINLGCLFQEWGQPAKAMGILEKASEEADARLADGDPGARSYLRYCRSRAAQALGRLDAALADIEVAQRIVSEQQTRARLRGERFQPIWLWQDFAELHLGLLLEKARRDGDPGFEERALGMIDLARSQRLFELVVEGQIGVRAVASESLLRREREIQAELSALGERRWSDVRLHAGSGLEPDPSERRLNELVLELERVRSAIRASDPRYARLVSPLTLDLETLRSRLDAETLVLRYVLGKGASYLFAFGCDTWEVYELPPREVLEPQVVAVYRALKQDRHHDRQSALMARCLARELLPPGAVPPGIRRVYLVLDGALHYLPFAALPWPPTRGSIPAAGTSDHHPPAEEHPLLIDRLAIHYAPSTALLQILDAPLAAERPWSAAVFADPVFSDDDARLTHGQRIACGAGVRSVTIERLPMGDLPRLPCTRREADALLARIDPRHRLGLFDFEASKARFLATDLSGYRIIHLATHAFVDEDYPELSGLVLSRRDSTGAPIEGNLFLHEIYGLDLDADLVTLSGCQTALGREVRGDGLLSMTRGFLYAGARRVLVSLWTVDDRATSELMSRFYRSLLVDGDDPLEALRTAQLEMRRQPRWSAPYFWAGFVLQGAP